MVSAELVREQINISDSRIEPETAEPRQRYFEYRFYGGHLLEDLFTRVICYPKYATCPIPKADAAQVQAMLAELNLRHIPLESSQYEITRAYELLRDIRGLPGFPPDEGARSDQEIFAEVLLVQGEYEAYDNYTKEYPHIFSPKTA